MSARAVVKVAAFLALLNLWYLSLLSGDNRNNFDKTNSTTAEDGIYQHDVTDLPPVAQCTEYQRQRLSEFGAAGGKLIHMLTKCPKPKWIEEYYEDGAGIDAHTPFLGISVGCNKGHDAIRTGRMGMLNPKLDGVKWKDAIAKQGPQEKPACKADNSKQANTEGKKQRDGEMHCIEPMPNTYTMLNVASKELGGLEKENFIISNAAISSGNGKTRFPKGLPGKEDMRIGEKTCAKPNPAVCVDIPMYTLDTYVNKFVTGKGPINILQIDTEGWDFDVLFGASAVLDRTQYLEFEYHLFEPWGSMHLQDAVKLLDRKGFTCYWSGAGSLWRITNCYFEVYDTFHNWSNVACVHRSENILASLMEEIFSSTITK